VAEPITAEEKKNDKVRVTIRKFPHCRVELEVVAGNEQIQKARKEALKIVKKEVVIPGFRKGKAPDEMIQKNYSVSIQDKTQKTLADTAFASAMELVKIPILNNNSPVQFHLNRISESEATLTFSFESEPEVPSIDSTNFQLKEVIRPETGEKELNEAIRQMRLFYSKWVPITDRKVEEGDFILIDLETLEEPTQKVFSDTRFEVSDAQMAKWMKKLVIGKESGASVEGLSEPDADLSEEKKKEFKPKRVLLTIKKIEKAEMPELNEEFAKKVGATGLEQMKQYLRDMIEKKADEKVDHEKREQVNDFLLNYGFDIPLSLIQKEKEHRRKQYTEDPRYQAKIRHMTDLQKDMERLELEELIENQSESAVRLFYASRQVIRDAKINVSYEEVKAEALRSLQVFGPVRIDQQAIPEEVFALALSKIILSRAQDHILKGQ
jgi:trigger factor